MRGMRAVKHDMSFTFAGQKLGFVDMLHLDAPDTPYTQVYLGPLGSHRFPAPASIGWGFVAIMTTAAIALIVATAFRRMRREANPIPESGG